MSKFYLVGGAGYIGTALQQYLEDEDRFELEVIDIGIHGNVENPQDIREIDPPGDGTPVVWLASQHMEPPGLNEAGRWVEYAVEMEASLLRWRDAGHPILYTSSMQVLTNKESTYAAHKRYAEGALLGRLGCMVLRFGTVTGGYDLPVCRPHTVPNRVILDPEFLPSDDYAAYWTAVTTAVVAIADAMNEPELWAGEVMNIEDFGEPVTIETCRWIKDQPVNELINPERAKALLELPHPTRLLAEKVGLPYE